MSCSRPAVLAALFLLTACSEEAKVDKRAGEAKQLQSGEYEVTAKIASLISTDKSAPATRLKPGDTVTTRGCVGADGVPAAALFADSGDQCRIDNSYVSGAILSLAVKCTRTKPAGNVASTVDGGFTATAFTAKVTTDTSFYGTGDYQIVRDVAGKRVGACPPSPAANG